jgi:cellobiose transport system substrate-binding protein
VLAGGLAAACGGGDDKKKDSGSGPVTLTVDTFGEFGYEQLYKQYEASHPGVTIKQRKVSTLDDYKPRVQQWIATGSGAGDVIALEEGILPTYMQQRAKFLNLFDYGGAALKDKFLPWKWQMGLSPDGKQLVGLGSDIGPLAMCYRTDLFKKAGLPTDRDAVSKLWPTWDAFLTTGQKFQSKVPGSKFLDGPTAVFRATVLQNAGAGPGYSFFDKSNNLVFDTNPAVKQAFDTALKFEQNKLTADMSIFTPPWQTALKRDTFATLPCPSWMLGVVKEQSGPELAGKWAVTDAFPGGGGNWGGSYLAVPKQSKHPKEAAELAAWLTAPEQQIKAFKAKGPFPSQVKALDSPDLLSTTNDYFGGAKTGDLFAKMARKVGKAQYKGPGDGQIQENASSPALQAVEQGKSAADGWNQMVEAAKKITR